MLVRTGPQTLSFSKRLSFLPMKQNVHFKKVKLNWPHRNYIKNASEKICILFIEIVFHVSGLLKFASRFTNAAYKIFLSSSLSCIALGQCWNLGKNEQRCGCLLCSR